MGAWIGMFADWIVRAVVFTTKRESTFAARARIEPFVLFFMETREMCYAITGDCKWNSKIAITKIEWGRQLYESSKHRKGNRFTL